MTKTKFGSCMSGELKGKLKGKPKEERQKKFSKAVRKCRKNG